MDESQNFNPFKKKDGEPAKPEQVGGAKRIENNFADIFGYAEEVALVARESDVLMTFNKKELEVPKGEYDSIDIAKKFMASVAMDKKNYRNSPEGKAKTEKDAKELANKQKFVDALTNQLESLDFSDTGKILSWILAYGNAVNHEDIKVNYDGIVQEFFIKGYFTSEYNKDNKYDLDDKESIAKWLISEALDNILQNGTVYSRLLEQIKEWKTKFNS